MFSRVYVVGAVVHSKLGKLGIANSQSLRKVPSQSKLIWQSMK